MAARRVVALASVTMLAVLVAACRGNQPAAPAAEPAAPPAPKVMTAAERAKWYQDCWELFNTKTWDQFKTCYGNEIVSDDVDSGRPTATGPDAVIAAARETTTAFPDMRGQGQLILINGNHVAGLYLVTATNSGPMKQPDGTTMPATNKKLGYMFAHVIETTADGGKAIAERAYSDAGTMLYQLGVSTAPARALMETGASAPTIVVASMPDAEAKNVEAFRGQMEMFNKRDLKGVDSYNAPDVVYHDYTQPKDVDAKANGEMLAGFIKAFPDSKLSSTSVWGAGDYVVNEGVFEGTNTGAFPAMEIKKPTNKPVRIRYVEIARYENGKVKEDWLLFNTVSLAMQLGLGGA